MAKNDLINMDLRYKILTLNKRGNLLISQHNMYVGDTHHKHLIEMFQMSAIIKKKLIC